MHRSSSGARRLVDRASLVLVLALFSACGGGTQEGPRNQGEAQPQFEVRKDGESTWPPVGPGCEELVACCKDASAGRPDVDLACKLSAAEPDCPTGRKAVIELLDSDGAAVPSSCR